MRSKKILSILLMCALALLIFTPAAVAKSHERPFKLSLSGNAVFTPGSEFGLPPNPDPPYIYTISAATGNGSHLGLCDMFSYHPTPTGEDFAGQMTVTAADGDELYMEYTGHQTSLPVPGVPSTIAITGDFTITGGTGRFEDVSGAGEYTAAVEFGGVFDPGPWPVVWSWNGTITY